MAETMPVAQADYALDLLRESGADSEALILSPFSIAMALAVAYLGSAGKTKEEMNTVLARGNSDEQFHSFVGQQIREMLNANNGYTLRVANRLYVQSGFPLMKPYVDAVKSKYSGQLQQADFRRAAVVTKEINGWVEQQTNRKIQNLISPGDLSGDTRLVIVNAVYFKGDWAAKFEKRLTKPKPFYSSSNHQRQVDMMYKKDKYFYYEDQSVQVLGLPYRGYEVMMYVFLPTERFGLNRLLESISGQELLQYMKQTSKTEVEVELPKFKLEKGFKLNDVLNTLGIQEAFTSSANFSGISKQSLSISQVIHKAFIEVNEEGTEAAAATAVIMTKSSALRPKPQPRFIADHPFIFAIAKGESLLFVGKYC